MSKKYTFEKQEKLYNQLEKLVKKLELREDIVQIKKIKSIIEENNPSVSKMKNSNGCWLDIENLTDKTYDELTYFVDKHEKRILKEIESELLETTDLSDTEIISDESENVSKKLRLTNTENHILNRVKYEEELKKNEEIGQRVD